MITEAIENLLNRNLGASPRARVLCTELSGRAVAVEVRGTPWHLTIESLGESLKLWRVTSGTAPPAVHARVSGHALALARLASPDPEEVLRRGDVRIEGDAELAQRFRELALLLRPDVEEELARLLGDTAAHRLWRAAQLMLGFGRRAADTAVRNVAEYLAHERGDLVPRAEADQFLAGVDRLREDADRLEARLALLEARAARPGEASGDLP